MVFTLLDRILGGVPDKSALEMPWSIVGHLRNEGFSFSEAKSLSWIINHRMKGEILGGGLGLSLVYFTDKGLKRWCMRYSYPFLH